MRGFVLTLGLCIGVATAAAAQDAKVAKGQQVYTDQKCSLCHSIAGKGNAKGSLDGVGGKLTADEIRSWITDAKGMAAKTKATRKPEMKQYTLPKDDVDAVVADLSSLKEEAASESRRLAVLKTLVALVAAWLLAGPAAAQPAPKP